MSDKKPEENKNQPVEAAPAAITAPRRNLTRESLELTIAAKLVEQGKSEKDAKAAAQKRALEMIPD